VSDYSDDLISDWIDFTDKIFLSKLLLFMHVLKHVIVRVAMIDSEVVKNKKFSKKREKIKCKSQ